MTELVSGTTPDVGAPPGPPAGELPPVAANPRFPCFDSMRVVGMLLVIATHVHFTTYSEQTGWTGRLLDRMDFGVTLFFMLSGFLLYRPYAVATLTGRPFQPTRSFLWKRALRVFPGYWFALTFVILAFGLHVTSDANVTSAPSGPGEYLVYYLLLQPFFPAYVFGGIKQSWSLTAEFGFYFLLPPFAFAVARLGGGRDVRGRLRLALGGIALLYLAGQAFRAYFVFAKPSWQVMAPIWLPNWIDIIALGMAIAAISAAQQCGVPLPSPLRWLSDRPGVSWLAGIALFFSLTFLDVPLPNVFTGEYVVRYFVFGIVGLLLLLPAMLGDQDQGTIRRVLRSKVLTTVGFVSLGVYLVHVDFLNWIRGRLDLAPFQGPFVVLFVATLLVSLVFAFVSHYGVEKPFLRLKDRSRARSVTR